MISTKSSNEEDALVSSFLGVPWSDSIPTALQQNKVIFPGYRLLNVPLAFDYVQVTSLYKKFTFHHHLLHLLYQSGLNSNEQPLLIILPPLKQ